MISDDATPLLQLRNISATHVRLLLHFFITVIQLLSDRILAYFLLRKQPITFFFLLGHFSMSNITRAVFTFSSISLYQISHISAFFWAISIYPISYHLYFYHFNLLQNQKGFHHHVKCIIYILSIPIPSLFIIDMALK